MSENERLPDAGARRLFGALESIPYLDAGTDEELDLFVCGLLSDVDKAKLEERTRKDPYLAADVHERKVDFDAHKNAGGLNEITGRVINRISARLPGPQLTVVPEQGFPEQGDRRPVEETRSVSQSGRKLPAWFLIAAAFVALIGIAVVIVNRGEYQGNAPELARNEISDLPSPSSSPNAADIAAVMGDRRNDQSVTLNSSPAVPEPTDGLQRDQLMAALADAVRTRYAGFEALLEKPEITESGLRLMGPENPEIERKYEGRTLSIVYFNRTKKKLPFALLPIKFEKGTAEIADEESRANISGLATFLKGFGEAELRVTIEVHARVAMSSESDEELSQSRAARLQSLLEGQGVPHATLYDAKGFGTHSSRTLPPISGDAQPAVLIIREQ